MLGSPLSVGKDAASCPCSCPPHSDQCPNGCHSVSEPHSQSSRVGLPHLTGKEQNLRAFKESAPYHPQTVWESLSKPSLLPFQLGAWHGAHAATPTVQRLPKATLHSLLLPLPPLRAQKEDGAFGWSSPSRGRCRASLRVAASRPAREQTSSGSGGDERPNIIMLSYVHRELHLTL